MMTIGEIGENFLTNLELFHDLFYSLHVTNK